MKEFVVTECIATGWEYAKKHGLMVAVIILVVSLVSSGISSLFSAGASFGMMQELGQRMAQGDPEATQKYMSLWASSSYGSIFGSILSIIVSTGIINFVLQVMTGRVQSLEFSAFKLPLNTYIKFVVAQIIYGIIVGFGTLLCIIPGLFLSARLMFVGTYIIDNPTAGIGDAFKASWEMTSSHTLGLIGLCLASIGICILGFLCCCIGYYFSAALIYFISVAAYLTLSDSPIAQAQPQE